jgi:hypothetical protein
MDVLSLRKQSGEVTGEIHLNGFPQEPNAFRRCAGYVEQFDTQSPQLTIRETVDFSAKMRLDESIPVRSYFLWSILVGKIVVVSCYHIFHVDSWSDGNQAKVRRPGSSNAIARQPSRSFCGQRLRGGLEFRAKEAPVYRC